MFVAVRLLSLPHLSYYKVPTTLIVNTGDAIIVEDAVKEFIYAEIVSLEENLPRMYKEEEIASVVRKATKEDREKHILSLQRSEDARKFCKMQIIEQNLPMKLIAVETLFSMTKIIFYFTAPERVDFRGLIKVLVDRYKERIELRQTGVRNEVQMLGAIGGCGYQCCCSSHLRDFIPVSVKMAKQQNISLNPVKMSGVCGRLLCCLSYEYVEDANATEKEDRSIGKKHQDKKK